MEAWIGVITSFCLIIGCFGMIVVLFFWDETIVYCCTQYVHLHEEEVEVSDQSEGNKEENEEENDEENEMEEDNHLQVVSENDGSEEEDDTEQNNHVILQVGSSDDEIQAAQATTKRFLSSDSYTLRFAQV